MRRESFLWLSYCSASMNEMSSSRPCSNSGFADRASPLVDLLAVEVLRDPRYRLYRFEATSRPFPLATVGRPLVPARYHSRLPKLSRLPLFIRQLQLLPYSSQLASVMLMNLRQQPRVFLLQFDKLLFKLLVPGIEHKDLETEGGRADEKVGQGKSFRYHCFKCREFLSRYARMVGSIRPCSS